MIRLNQSGSHVIGVALLVLALGVVGFAGYKVIQAHNNTTTTSQPSTTTTATVTVPKTITNAADLQKVDQFLTQASAQLNTNLNSSSLNTDLNSML